MSFFECFALRFEFSERSGLRLSLHRDVRVDHRLELHFLLSPRARDCFDIGFGACTLSQNARRFNFSTGSRLRCGERFSLRPHTGKRRCGHRALGLDPGCFPRFSLAIGLRLPARSRRSNPFGPGKGGMGGRVPVRRNVLLRLRGCPKRCGFVRVGAVVLGYLAADQTFARLTVVCLIDVGAQRHRVRLGPLLEGCVAM